MKIKFTLLLLLLANADAISQNIQFVQNGTFNNPVFNPPPAGANWTGVQYGAMPMWDIDRCFPFVPDLANSVDVYSSTQVGIPYGMPATVPSSTGSNPESMIGMFGNIDLNPAFLNQETVVSDLIAPMPAGKYRFSIHLRQRVSTQNPNDWSFEVFLQKKSQTGVGICNRANELRIYTSPIENTNWIYPSFDICIPDANAGFYDRISMRMVYHGTTPVTARYHKYIYVDNVSLERVRYNPDFTIGNISCMGYGMYQVQVSGNFNGGTSNWQLYSGGNLNYNPLNVIPGSALVGVTGNTATIMVPGHPGDQFVIKHGTYGTCVAWNEKLMVLTIPCNPAALNPAFNYSISCNQNAYTLSVLGSPNPCDTYWQYNLIDAANGNILQTIGWYGNNAGNYNANSYTFNSNLLVPCHNYTIQHGVWNECSGWIQEVKNFTTVACVPLTASFVLRKTTTSPPQTTFLYNDPILFDGIASTGETRYYVDLWEWNGTMFNWIAAKNGTGWTPGQAGIFDVRAEFSNIGLMDGRFKLKLAVANDCIGWLPIEKEFFMSCPICMPPGSGKTDNEASLDESEMESISVSPNPFTDQLTIYTNGISGNIKYDLLNSLGQIVWQGEVTDHGTIETSSFSAGVYFLRFENGIVRRLVK
jgi:Secretion system C-terminal sorting domain